MRKGPYVLRQCPSRMLGWPRARWPAWGKEKAPARAVATGAGGGLGGSELPVTSLLLRILSEWP